MRNPDLRVIRTCIVLSGEPASWQIIKPDLSAIQAARKRGNEAVLTIRIFGEPETEQTIRLSEVRIRKHEKKGGFSGYTIETWTFSAWIKWGRKNIGMGRMQGKLWFEGGQLTGEIRGWIPLPPKVKS